MQSVGQIVGNFILKKLYARDDAIIVVITVKNIIFLIY